MLCAVYRKAIYTKKKEEEKKNQIKPRTIISWSDANKSTKVNKKKPEKLCHAAYIYTYHSTVHKFKYNFAIYTDYWPINMSVNYVCYQLQWSFGLNMNIFARDKIKIMSFIYHYLKIW